MVLSHPESYPSKILAGYMDALLINIPSGQEIQFGEPLGIQYVAAFSRAQGFDVEILDAAAHKLNNDQVASHVEKHDYKLVGISANFNTRLPDVIKLTRLLRDRGIDCHITYGGVAASLLYKDILLSVKGVDSVVVGEGEYTFYRLLQAIKSGREWRGTPGIAYRDGEQIIYRVTELIKNLDELPFPRLVDYKQKPYDKYEVLFSSSRGCYASCNFCCINSFYRLNKGRKWRCRSTANVVQELKMLNKQGVRTIGFVDDNFLGFGTNGAKRAHELAAAIKQEGIDIRFAIEARVTEIKDDILKPLVESGLRQVFVGVESVNQRTLDYLNKGTTVQDNYEALRTLERLGIKYDIGYILFEPGTTVQELLTSLKFLRELPTFSIKNLNRLFIFRGTPLYESLGETARDTEFYQGYGYKFNDPIVNNIWIVIESILNIIKRSTLLVINLNILRGSANIRQNIEPHNYRSLNEETDRLIKQLINISKILVDQLIEGIEDGIFNDPDLATSKLMPQIEAELSDLNRAAATLGERFKAAVPPRLLDLIEKGTS